jgi:hypothetical protein
MKKLALLALFAAFTSISLFAQDTTGVTTSQPATSATPAASNEAPKFRMGLSGSTVLSWINPDADESVAEGDGTRFSIQYGLHLDFRLGSNENYYFSTGLFLLNTGGTLRHNIFDGSELTIDHRINYLNVPLTMMLRTKEIGYTTYFARVGADAGFNISSSYDVTESMNGETTTMEDVDDNLAGLFRAALHFEAGVEYNISGNTRLFASLEWNDGLVNVFTDEYKVQSNAPTADSDGMRRIKGNTDAFLLNVGIYF